MKQLTNLIKIREILIFLLIWPILPTILMFFIEEKIPYFFHILIVLYKWIGWYIAARIYQYRTKKYEKETTKSYSLWKEILLFLLIWPLGPIILNVIFYGILYILNTVITSEKIIFCCLTIPNLLLMIGWLLALYVFRKRLKSYYLKYPQESEQIRHKISVLVPFIIIFVIVFTIGYFVFKTFYEIKDWAHQEYTKTGEIIRLKITEEECKNYPNRYWFNNLCIICPDEQPLEDGHCHRCPGESFVVSNGCRACDTQMNYITPKIECDACPNRIYEDGLCKPHIL